MRTFLIGGLLTLAVVLPAAAQTLSSIKLEPPSAKAGEPVKITVDFTGADNPNCNVRLYYGDGASQDFKINQTKDVPMIATHTYAKAGDYKVMAEGKTALPMLKCIGKNQVAMLKVSAPAPVTKAAAVAAVQCPDGWNLEAKSVNKKTGAYTCAAKAGTALPATRLDCPAPLGYFENKSKGQLGCRP